MARPGTQTKLTKIVTRARFPALPGVKLRSSGVPEGAGPPPPAHDVPARVGKHCVHHVPWELQRGVVQHPAKSLPRGTFTCSVYSPPLPGQLQGVARAWAEAAAAHAMSQPVLARGWTWIPPGTLHAGGGEDLRNTLTVTARVYQNVRAIPAWQRKRGGGKPAVQYVFDTDVGHAQGAAPGAPRDRWSDGAIPMYRNLSSRAGDRGGLWVPRGLACRICPPTLRVADRMQNGAALRAHCAPALAFLPHIPQQVAHDAVLAHWERAPAGGAACLVLMPCGYGKSITALHIIVSAGRRAIWLVQRRVLAEDAADAVCRMFPGAERVRKAADPAASQPKTAALRVAVMDGRSRAVHPATCGADILVVSVHTLLSRCSEYTLADWKTYGTLVVDEAHMLSPRHMHALAQIPAKRSLGLSATPYRGDGTTRALYWTMGPLVFACRRPAMSLVGEIWVWEGGPRVIKRRGSAIDDVATLTALCAQDSQRRSTVVAAALACIAQGRCVLVMGARVQYLRDIAAAVRRALVSHGAVAVPNPNPRRSSAKKSQDLTEDGIVYDGELMHVGPAVCMHAQTPVDVRQAILGRTACVCAHPGIAKVGLSCAALDTIIMATPLTDPEQIVGRITRANSKGKVPLVIDVVDPYAPHQRAWASRRNAYDFLDMQMQSRKIEREVTPREAAAFLQQYNYAALAATGGGGGDDGDSEVPAGAAAAEGGGARTA